MPLVHGGDYEEDNNYHREVIKKVKELRCQKVVSKNKIPNVTQYFSKAKIEKR